MEKEFDEIDQEDPIPLPKGFVAVKKSNGEMPLPKGFEPVKKKSIQESGVGFGGAVEDFIGTGGDGRSASRGIAGKIREAKPTPKLDISGIETYNKQFREETGLPEFTLGSDLPQIKEQREKKEYQEFRDIEENEIKPFQVAVMMGNVSPSQLKDLYSKPHGKKVVTDIINAEIPGAANIGLDEDIVGRLDEDKRWDGIAAAIQEKNRGKGIEAHNQIEYALDNELANDFKNLSYGDERIGIEGKDEAVMKTTKNQFGEINTTSFTDLEDARKKIVRSDKVWGADGEEVDKKALLEKIQNRQFQLKSQEPLHPEITGMAEVIQKAVAQVPVEWKRKGGNPELATKDADYVMRGLNYLKDTSPGEYAMIMGSMESLGKISETQYQELVELGRDMKYFSDFKSGNYVERDERSFMTPQIKKAHLSGWLSQKLKEDRKSINRFKVKDKDMVAAYEQAPEELKDDELFNELRKQEAVGAGGMGVRKTGGIYEAFHGFVKPFKAIAGSLETIGESPFETYLKSKELDRGDQKIPQKGGGFGENLPSNTWANKAVGGFFNFLAQTTIARGIGMGTAGVGNSIIGRVAPRATISTNAAALNVGTPLSVLGQTFKDEYVDFMEKTGDPTKAGFGAFLSSTAQGIIERFVLPDVKIADKIGLLNARREFAKDIIKVVEKGEGRDGIKRIAGEFLANASKMFGKEVLLEENLQNFTNLLTEQIISPNTAQDRDFAQETADITSQAATEMSIALVLGGAGETKLQKDLTKAQFHHIGANHKTYQEALDRQFARGLIPPAEYEKASQFIKLHGENVLSAPKRDANGELISAERQLEYAYQSTVQQANEEEAAKQKDKVQREPFEKKIEEADKIKRQIFYGEENKSLPPKESEPIEINQERDLNTEGDLTPEGVLLNAVESGQVKGTYADLVKQGQAIPVLQDIAQQAQNLNQDGTAKQDGKEDASMKATVDQFGQDVVDAAIKQFPKEQSKSPTIEQAVKSFAERIVSGEKMESAEDIQFYENNKTQIEAELKNLASGENIKEPVKGDESIKTEKKSQPETTVNKDSQPTGKASQKARDLAAKIREKGLREALPNWAKADLPEGTESAGFGGKFLDEAVAKAIELVADAMDAGKSLADAIKDGYANLKDYYSKNTKSFDEDKVRGEFEKNMTELFSDDSGKPPVEPPPTETKPEGKERLNEKGILNRLYNAKNVPQAAKEGFEKEGLNYKTSSQEEAAAVAKAIVDEWGIDDAILAAESMKFDGDVNSLIFAEALNSLSDLEETATTQEEKNEAAKKFAEVAITYDKTARVGGKFNAAINHFYKKSPLGIVLKENADRKQEFDSWAKPKDKTWKEFFDEMMKEPEFEAVVKEQVKKERAEERQTRKEKVHKTIDDTLSRWANKLKAKGAEGAQKQGLGIDEIMNAVGATMKKAYDAGEAVAKIIQDAIDYISEQLGTTEWNSEDFREEWTKKLQDKQAKKPLTDEEVKAKVLDKFRKKLKGLSDKQKDEVVRKAFKKIVDNGGLDYQDFRDIIASVTGMGQLTPEDAAKLKELVQKTNAVGEKADKLRVDRTDKSFEEYKAAQVEAGRAAKELNDLVYNKPDIIRRLTSIVQLSTLGIPALINNPIYNIINQVGLRLPVGVVNSAIDLFTGGKEYNIIAGQVEFWKKLGEGSKESMEQIFSGLNRMDYTQKELYTGQIRPVQAWRDLIAHKRGKKKLTKAQWWDKLIQGTAGIPAEVVARFLNVGDKPQRFAAEGAQAATFAKALGLKGMDYKLFVEFPREEAYRAYKGEGLSDEEAGQKADYVKEAIVKEGQRSTFQQDNLLNDVITAAAGQLPGGKEGGLAAATKTLTISPYIKIPTNAFWSLYNLLNPEIAILQSLVHAGIAQKQKNKGDITKSKLQNREARYWMAHAIVGMGWRAAIIALAQAGVFVPSSDDEDSKKERDAESFFDRPGYVNIGDVKISNRWFGFMGMMGNAIAKKHKGATDEQKQNQMDFWNIVLGGMELEALKELENGIFANSSSLLQSFGTGDFSRYGINTINLLANIVQPATIAQFNRAALDEIPSTRGDSFLQRLNQNFAQRSTIYRRVFDVQLNQKRDIWGQTIPKQGNFLMKLFGISQANPQIFARPVYDDYLRTSDSGFLPPAVLQTLNQQKISTKQYDKLQSYIGAERKDILEPYINDMAEIPLFGKYSQIKDDNIKKAALSYIYSLGRERGLEKFYLEYPELKPKEKTLNEQITDKYQDVSNQLIKLKK